MRVDEIVTDPMTEFEKGIARKSVAAVLIIMSELVDAVQVGQPALYRAVMRKINKL